MINPQPRLAGITQLDHLLHGGLRPGSLTLIAGRPGMGMEDLAVQLGSICYASRDKKFARCDCDYLLISREDAALERHHADQLKRIAGQLYIPFLCTAKLSRCIEQREDKHPQLQDLAESCGDLLDSADVVLLLYRDSYYQEGECPDTAQIIVAKNRFGETGVVHGHWKKQNACCWFCEEP